MIRKMKKAFADAGHKRLGNLFYILFLLMIVVFCFTRISSAIGLLSHNF